MKEKYLTERYEPPEIVVWQVSVEVGFANSEGGSTTPDMPIEPL